MIVFEVNKILGEVIGLKSIGDFKYRQYVVVGVPIFISVQMIFVTLLSFLNFVYNFNDNIHKALLSWAPTLGVAMYAMQYWHLLVNRAHFYSLFEDMQATINKST